MAFVQSAIYMPSYERFPCIVRHELQALLPFIPVMTSSGCFVIGIIVIEISYAGRGLYYNTLISHWDKDIFQWILDHKCYCSIMVVVMTATILNWSSGPLSLPSIEIAGCVEHAILSVDTPVYSIRYDRYTIPMFSTHPPGSELS